MKTDNIYINVDKNLAYAADTQGYTISTFPDSQKATIDISNANITGYDYEKLFQEMMRRMTQVPLMKHSCNSCGGTLEINADKHIFICPYCGSVYAIGTVNLKG